MKKQIIYPKFIPRLFAATIDLLIIAITVPFVMSALSKFVYSYVFKDYLLRLQETGADVGRMNMFYSPDFFEYVSASNNVNNLIICVLILNLINFTLIAIYYINFWKHFGATPGKLLMGMRIVDANSFEKPTTKQFIKRFFGYLTAFIGIWSILVTTHRQALHDKMSSTVVIKV